MQSTSGWSHTRPSKKLVVQMSLDTRGPKGNKVNHDSHPRFVFALTLPLRSPSALLILSFLHFLRIAGLISRQYY